MSLRVWLPLNGTLDNQGLDGIVVTNNGATVDNSGKIGKCYNFDGNNDYISFPYSFPSEDWSYSIWFYTTSTNTQTLGCCRNGVGFGFSIFLINSKIRIDGIIGNDNQQWTTTYTFPTNIWVNLIVTSKNGLIKYYINGEYQTNKTVTINNTKLGNVFTIGASQTNGNGLGNYFKGKINDVRIYNHALSPMEVKQISQGLILHYPLNNNGWGQENLITQAMIDTDPWKSAIQGIYTIDGKTGWILSNNLLYSKSGKGANNIFSGLTYEDNTQYTISFKWRDDYRTDGKESSLYIRFKYSDGTYSQVISSKNYNYWKEEVMTSTVDKTLIAITTTYGNGGNLLFTDLKLEKGSMKTSYSPIKNSELYNELGLNNNIQYDTSGYKNNGTKNNITYISDSPKYKVSSSFSGSSNYIKVNENNWISQGAEAMTVNFWAYSTDWSTRPKLISCTQSGGWNTQPGNTGYLRVPIHVYTNSAKTSTAYKYSSNEIKVSDLQAGWHMFTIVYDSTGNHIYLDGLSHSSYNFTSYGIHYNMNARLFIGCEASTASPASPYFKGNMSDVRIYCTALSAEDILSLYNNSAYIDNQGNIYGAIYEEV